MKQNTVHSFNKICCAYCLLSVLTSQCPIQLIPRRAVVRYGDDVSADYKTSGAVTMTRDSLITWRVSNLIEWDIQPYCYINHEEQCQVELPVTIYKTPDSVSISIVNHRGPMIEGKQYELQCDVHDVAPVQNLTDNKTPVNETTTLLIRPDRADDGAQYRCEAELELGAEGPQPPPKETSDPLNITVYYSNITLECSSTGNPEPEMWLNFKNKNISTGRRHITLNIERATSTNAGVYTCSATNTFGRKDKSFVVEIRGLGCDCENNMILPIRY
uniref:Ig-like domain-containing protein n=1 Tax=Sinocyclocheilus rhinocerous TaxID=307959 RepID=A0A673G7E9_9TELE